MGQLAEPDLLAMIARARAQDPDARNQLSALVRERMKGVFQSRVGPVESSDLAQDATFNVSLHLGGFQGNSEKEFWKWVHVVARNVAAASYRSRHAQKRGGPVVPLPEDSRGGFQVADPASTPSTVIQRHEQAAEVRAALALLNPQEQLLIRLRYEEGKDWSEVAQSLGKSIEATRKSYQRAIKKWSDKYRDL
jgi:RNA polymerase sigma factor (sigma-70 family)